MSRDDAVRAVRLALDDVLARGGFTWNDSGDQGLQMLYEALPDEVLVRTPHLDDWYGPPDDPCFDLWITFDESLWTITKVTIEAWSLPALLRERGLGDAAGAVEAATGLAEQVVAYRAAFGALFAAP